jgi:hypothetical protein
MHLPPSRRAEVHPEPSVCLLMTAVEEDRFRKLLMDIIQGRTGAASGLGL